MHHHNTPIAVWHSQPFEVLVLDTDMRWALVRYRNPREQPRTISLMRNWFVVRRGQAFGAVGNEACTTIKAWQFRWWLGWPTSKRMDLTVRKLSEKQMPHVKVNTPMPSVVAQVADEIQNNLLRKDRSPHIAIHIQPNTSVHFVNLNLSLNPLNDEPNLKSFHDTL
ncbi:MAG: hypothetical protein ACK478_04200 [Flavobacteriales bacterium]|jgi:hypothetical protein